MNRYSPYEPPQPGHQELRIFRGLLLFGGLLLLLTGLYKARMVLLPFMLAGVLAYVMNPLVMFLQLRGLRRGTAVSLLYVAVTLGVGAMAYWVFSIWWDEIPRLRYQWPLYLQQVQVAASQADVFLEARWEWGAERLSAARAVNSLIQGLEGSSVEGSARYLGMLASLAFNLFLIPFIGFFLLKGGRAGFQAMLDACPGRAVEKFLSLFYKVDGVIGGYLRGILIEALLVGSLAGIGLWVMGVDYAGLLGALAVVLNLVPFVGPLTAGGLAVAAAFLQFGQLQVPVQVAVLFLSVRLIDDFVIQPSVMSRSVHLHPALVIFSLLAGHEMAGVWGLVLAVPTVSIVKESAAVIFAWYQSEFGRFPLSPSLARLAAKPWVV